MKRLHCACILGIGLVLLACGSDSGQPGKDAAAVTPPPVSGNKDAPVPVPPKTCAFGNSIYQVGGYFTLGCTTYTCTAYGDFATAPACPDAAAPSPDAPIIVFGSDTAFDTPDAPASSDLKVMLDTMTVFDAVTERVPQIVDAQFDTGETGTDVKDAFAVYDVSSSRDAAPDTAVVPNPDTAPPCPGNQLLCSGICVDQRYNPANCGACGRQCSATETCSDGACLCANGMLNCDGTCSQLLNDANCGFCGNACPQSSSCTYSISASSALYSCTCDDPITTMCPTGCVDIKSSPSDCGSCGHPCLNDEICSQGVCKCANGGTRCNGICDTFRTNTSCSSCGDTCPSGSSCVTTVSPGVSLVSSCKCSDQNLTRCPVGCVDLKSSLSNCGSCGHACMADETCSNGTCVCANGGMRCSGSCSVLETDNANCGACGNPCPPASTCTTTVTSAGKKTGCQCLDPNQIACPSGCRNPVADPQNCGACNQVCAADEVCSNGTCICANGRLRCNGVCVDQNTDANNCGACGKVCGTGQACNNGACYCIDYADSWELMCDGVCVNALSSEHCGSCGHSCGPWPGFCAGGSCSCTGNKWCNGICTDLSKDGNCGDCGVSCGAYGSCKDRACHGSYGLCAVRTTSFNCLPAYRTYWQNNMEPNPTIQVSLSTALEILGVVFVPSSTMTITFDYFADANSSVTTPYFRILGDYATVNTFNIPYKTRGTASLSVRIPAELTEAYRVSLYLFGGDWGSTVRITNITFS